MKTLAIRSVFDFKFSGFRILGFRVCCLYSKNLKFSQGFEHVKGHAGFAAGKPRANMFLVAFPRSLQVGAPFIVVFVR